MGGKWDLCVSLPPPPCVSGGPPLGTLWGGTTNPTTARARPHHAVTLRYRSTLCRMPGWPVLGCVQKVSFSNE